MWDCVDSKAFVLLDEIQRRQGEPWNGNGIDAHKYPELTWLFKYINSRHSKPPYAYSGRLYRIHCPYVGLAVSKRFDEDVVSSVNKDGSCLLLNAVRFSTDLVSFSKSPDFTRIIGSHRVYPKIDDDAVSDFIVVDTCRRCGIDVCRFLEEYGVKSRFYAEQEVLYPLVKNKTLVGTYRCTPNEFKLNVSLY